MRDPDDEYGRRHRPDTARRGGERDRHDDEPGLSPGKISLTSLIGNARGRWRDSPPSADEIHRDAARAGATEGGHAAHAGGGHGYDMPAVHAEIDKLDKSAPPAATAAAAGPRPVPSNPQQQATTTTSPTGTTTTTTAPLQGADPYVLPLGATWYMYTTGLGIYKSVDQGKTWSYDSQLFPLPNGIVNAWAPEVHRVNGKFVCYVSLGKAHEPLQLYMATSSKPDSGFTLDKEPIVKSSEHAVGDPHPNDHVSMIDPTQFSRDGENWLIWKEDWKPELARRRIVIAKCNKEGKPVGKPHTILTAGEGPYSEREQRPDSKTPSYSVEAPTMIFHGGKYWLFYSGAGYERGGAYYVGVAWSDKPTGRFQREPRPLISGDKNAISPGHQSVIQVTIDGKPQWIIYYAARSPDDGAPAEDTKHDPRRFIMADPLHWGKDGPTVGDGHPSGGLEGVPAPPHYTPPTSSDSSG